MPEDHRIEDLRLAAGDTLVLVGAHEDLARVLAEHEIAARQLQVGLPPLTQTRYINTISPEQEPYFPGDEEMELHIRRLIRWNAVAMVLRANTQYSGIGGHLSTDASSASLYEVGFNHFFRGKDGGQSGDQIFYQGHAAPGIYARAFLEGLFARGARGSTDDAQVFLEEKVTAGSVTE